MKAISRSIEAWLVLTGLQVLIRWGRFARVQALLGEVPSVWKIAPSQADDMITTTVIALGRASRLALMPVRCLDIASACTCLLRLRGLPADVVIGVRASPFAAHAWTELHGRVIGDLVSVTDSYAPINRSNAPLS